MTSNPRFNKRTTATEVAKAYSEHIKGKTILITGVSPTSIGANTAYALASGEPEQMILASRTKEHRRRSRQYQIPLPFRESNTSNPRPIIPKLRKAAATTPGSTRVVMLTSNGHRFSPVRFHDYNFDGKPIPSEEEPGTQAMIGRGIGAPVFDEQGYDPFVAYGQSKTANILFALYLRAKLAREGIQAMSVHPGAIGTNLIRYYTNSPITNTIARCILRTNGLLGIGQFKTTDAGAATTIVAALDPKLSSLKDTEGIYLQDCQFDSPAAHATGFEAAEKLWTLSEELVGEKFVL
ncbi:hypothetical protein DTO166G4_9199 [Paecilomyces variotii]|nr:hypothetical protein DTO166G4_9199 [Paecilomyces variotii]KAJ9219766.1 hypothetical protein DTO169C6_7933 [Paecilomyces variotii]KAJ9228233.1 hypothetical protein DTO166G5_8736 [Paecilomyces variotii]KAJ9355258.1 hypothetical protein DTO027B9_4347 [Paecilomyces variotii]KAJ9403778.1 hypothetical protein DTO045G8_8512 [Paecilomyces variotii]